MMRSKISFVSAVPVILVALIAASGCGSRAGAANSNANNQPSIVDVTTTQAVVKPIPTYFEATGNRGEIDLRKKIDAETHE